MVFITVRHGANENTLFNQDCRSITLLNAIRDKCCSANDSEDTEATVDVIDLSDKEGNVKDLRKYPNMVAKEVLADREDFILLKVAENEKGKLVYTPLLENDELITKVFLDKLAKGSKRDTATTKSKTTTKKTEPSAATSSASSMTKRSAANSSVKRK